MALDLRALTQLQTVKDELGITDESKDGRLERLIHVATDLAEGECGRVFFYEAAITEKVASSGSPHIVVGKVPIVSITSITELGTALTSDDYEALVDSSTRRADSGIIVRKAGETALGQWPWTAARRPDIVQDKLPGTESRGITVVYAGGFVTPEQAASDGWAGPARSLPYDLEQAIIELVVSLYRSAGQDRNVSLEQVTDAQQSWGRGRDLIPDSVLRVLHRYRRIS